MKLEIRNKGKEIKYKNTWKLTHFLTIDESKKKSKGKFFLNIKRNKNGSTEIENYGLQQKWFKRTAYTHKCIHQEKRSKVHDLILYLKELDMRT